MIICGSNIIVYEIRFLTAFSVDTSVTFFYYLIVCRLLKRLVVFIIVSAIIFSVALFNGLSFFLVV